MEGKYAKAVKLGTPALPGPDNRGSVCILHKIIDVGQKYETVIRLVLILEYYRLVNTDGDVGWLNRMIVNRDFRDLDEQLFFLEFEPADDAEIEDGLAVRRIQRQRCHRKERAKAAQVLCLANVTQRLKP